jgi:type II secretion system protein N
MSQLRSFLKVLGFHRWRILLFFGLTFLFTFVFFPFGDLNDVISVQISKATQGQIYVTFEDIEVSIFPDPGLSLEKISLETPDIGPVSVDQLIFLPSISGLIAQKPSGIVKMRGILGGDLDLAVTPGKRTEAGSETLAVSASGKNLALNRLKTLLQLPVALSGKVALEAKGTVEPTFAEQPDVDLELNLEQFAMPQTDIDPPATGPITLPETKLGKVELKGRLSAGRFNIERANIGTLADELHGTIKGGVSLTLQNRGGLLAIPGSYNLDVDLTITTAFEPKLRTFPFLMALDQYKSTVPTGTRYAVKIAAPDPQYPPTMSPLR